MKRRFLVLLALILACVFVLSSCNAKGGRKEENTTSASTPLVEGNKDAQDTDAAAKYEEALEYLKNGKYNKAYDIFEELGDYEDAEEYLEKFRYVPVTIVNPTYEKTIHFEYNEDNLLEECYVIYNDGDRGTSEKYFYDGKNNLIKFTETYSSGSTYVRDYQYDNAGNCIKQINTNTSGEKTVYEFEFDDNGNCIKQVSTHASGEKTIYVCEFDTNGNCIKEKYSDSDGDWEEFQYSYNKDGNCIKGKYTDSDGYWSIEEYECDADGNCI